MAWANLGPKKPRAYYRHLPCPAEPCALAPLCPLRIAAAGLLLLLPEHGLLRWKALVSWEFLRIAAAWLNQSLLTVAQTTAEQLGSIGVIPPPWDTVNLSEICLFIKSGPQNARLLSHSTASVIRNYLFATTVCLRLLSWLPVIEG